MERGVRRPSARILLVEDDDDIAGMYEWRLAREGYRVEVVRDGVTAVGEAAETLPDLIFLDIRLPGIDGIEVLRRLRGDESTNQIPVVVITSYDDPLIKQETRDLGATAYLVKSKVTPSALAASVDGWLARIAPTGEHASLEQARQRGDGQPEVAGWIAKQTPAPPSHRG
jgi:DNA-binding response OmpR family regulator